MKATQKLHELGQSIWLDNITRDLLTTGTLKRYITELSVTGLTSNPTIFDHAIRNSADYDGDIARNASHTNAPEELFFELALADLSRAADLLRPVFTRTDGVDGRFPPHVLGARHDRGDRAPGGVRAGTRTASHRGGRRPRQRPARP